MFIIADSGSTKCDWIVYDIENQRLDRIRTKGLNPTILSKKAIKHIIAGCEGLLKNRNKVTDVFFFGAGCDTSKYKKKINSVLRSFFTNAITTSNEDIMAAVYATTRQPAVVCILGTGSNCCFFDGEKVHLKVPSLGYTIMDEGSGNYFGKQLIRKYYYNQMPNELKILFEEKYDLNEKKVIEKLYKSPNPNRYLADFARFLFENNTHSFILELITEGINIFIENHIVHYKEELKTVPLHFVGSMAYHSQEFIKDALKSKGLKAASFVRRPIDNLFLHYKKEIINSQTQVRT